MHAKLVLIISCLYINNIITVEGLDETVDQLEEAPKTLEYAFIIFRHGIRSPVNNIYESHEEFLKTWPEGEGALTEDGKKLMVRVGQSLRTRYKNLVPNYNTDQVEFTSTLSPRATMSANSVAAGMFPPPPDEVIAEDVPSWQPIPVWHTADYDKHDLFDELKDNAKCPSYTAIRDTILTEEMNKLPQNKKNNLERIKKKLESSKSHIKKINNMEDLFDVWDVYYMEKLNKRTSDPLAKNLLWELTQLAQFRLWSRIHGKTAGHHSILQFYTGPILNQILKEMIQQSSQCLLTMLGSTTPDIECRPRLHLHGSHDLTVGAMVWALAHKQEKFMADPGDTLILEGHRNQWAKLFLYSPLKPGRRKLKQLSLKDLCNSDTCHYSYIIKGLHRLGLVFSEDEWKQKCSDMTVVEKSVWRRIP